MSGEKSYRKPSRCGDSYAQDEYGKSMLTKSRSLGVFALILALFIFQVAVFLWDKVFVKDADSASFASNLNEESFVGQPVQSIFEFDPNTITLDSLCMLGLSPRQAQTILNYRAKGGRFERPEDFARMYVVSDEFYEKVRPYICVKSAEKVTKSRDYVPEGVKTGEMGTKRGRFVPEKMNSKSVKLIVELNGADSAELVKLYGIGPYYAAKILAYRERLGGFHSVEQLMEVSGIDSARFEGLAKNVAADPLKIRNFRLDTAGKAFLMAHPYIGAYTARGIILLRDKLGKSACTLENLIKERVIAPHMAEKLWPYVR